MKQLLTYTTSNDAVGTHATPTSGAPYWRGKVGIVTGVVNPKPECNPLMRIKFRWNIDGSQLPHEEVWQMPLLSISSVAGFSNEIRKCEERELNALIEAVGAVNLEGLEAGDVSRTCQRCGSTFTTPDVKQHNCPDCIKETTT